LAQEAGAIISPQWGVASNVGTATFERFATLCRADLVAENAALKQAHEINADTLNAMQVEIDDWKARALKAEQVGEQTSAVPVVEQLVEAFLKVARMAEALKKDCGMDPESRQAIRNGEYMNISYTARAAIAAGQQFLKESGE